MSHADIDIKISQNDFSKRVGLSRKKLQLMAAAGILVPFKDGDAKTAPCYYKEEQAKNIQEYLRAYDEWKKANRKKPTVTADVSVSPFGGEVQNVADADTNAVTQNSGEREIEETVADVSMGTVSNKQTRIAEAERFFDLLFGKLTAPHFSYLIKFSGGMDTFTFTVADETQRRAMARKAIELSDMGVDIWHAVNPVSVKPHYEFDAKKNKNVLKRGDEDVVSYQTAVIVDIDIRSEAHKGDPSKLAADFDEAKSFLPFPPSILIDSGYGLHAYYLFAAPLAVTDDNREEIKRRNKLLIDVIRARADKKLIDGVDDLPRIFRTPGTFNYKCGRDAPLCKLVEVNDIRFTPADLDERLATLAPAISLTTPPEPVRAADSKSDNVVHFKTNVPLSEDSPDLKAFRIRHMLPCINVVDGEYNKWLQVGMGLYNEGLECADWEQWSRTQPEFKEGECSDKWLTFSKHNDGIKIGTLYQWAVEGGYDEKDVQRKWYQLNPELSKKHDTAAQIEKLKADLRENSKALADFDAQKDAALERLRNVETFDSDTVLADDVVEAAAFAKLYDRRALSAFKRAIKNYGNEHKDSVVNANDFRDCVKDKADELATRRAELTARATDLQAQINSVEFLAADDDLRGIKIPYGYSVNNSGIQLVAGEKLIPVARLPVVIKSKSFDMDDENYKLILSYKTEEGKWRRLPAQEVATVSDKHKIVALSNKGLPVTSTTAKLLVDYLDAFRAENEKDFPLTYTFPRCGWHELNGSEFFLDPRRECVITEDGKQINVAVDSSSQFAKSLHFKGSLAEWKRAYDMAKSSPVARLMIAASVAAPLLKVLGERNFWLHINAPTRAGKTTALLLGASAVGSEKIIRSFDATKNGLTGAAADVNDYVFAIDEKQVADKRMSEQFGNLIYSLVNGIGRTKQNRDSSLMDVKVWQTIVLTTGETELTPDNATGGADTRLLPINVPRDKDKDNAILSADVCKKIRDIVKENYGHALPLVIDKIIEHGKENLRGWYKDICDAFKEAYPDILDEYRRYMAVMVIADGLLNSALGVDKALPAATQNAAKIFPLIPTTEEISDTAHEKKFVLGFITAQQNHFISEGNNFPPTPTPIYGKLKADDSFTYITVEALRGACKDAGFDYRKLVADLVADGFFVPSDKIKKGCKKPMATVQKKIGKVNTDCYRIPNDALNSGE